MAYSLILGIALSTFFVPVVHSQKVAITPYPTAYVAEGKSLTLNCSYSGTLTTNRIHWFRNGEAVATLVYENGHCTVNQSIVSSGGQFRHDCRDSLSWTILKVLEGNHGERWSCKVGDIDSQATSVYVQIPVKFVNFTSPPGEEIAAEERVPLMFTCITSLERPRSKITWVFRSEFPLDPMEGRVLNQNNDTLDSTSASLRFYPFRAYGKFEVNCVANNGDFAVPVASNKKIIDVTYPPKVRLNHYHTILAGEGDPVVLNITATSNPVSTCQWILNNVILTEINGSEIVYEINSISRHDDGHYICRCRNGIGYDGVEVRVHVFWRPQSINIDPIKTLYVIENGTLVPDINCSADCNPPCQIIWQKFSVYNTSTHLPAHGVPTIEKPTLSLGHVTAADSGTYVCVVISYIPGGYSLGSGVKNFKSSPVTISVV